MSNRTRTSDGTIARTKYDYSTLRLRGEASTPNSLRSLNTKYRKQSRSAQDGRTGMKVVPCMQPSKVDPAALKRPTLQPPREDIAQGVHFIPATAFGEYQAKGLSVIGHAERRIAQWETIREAHAQHLPRVLPLIDKTLRDAREKLQNLLDDEGNLQANSSVSNDQKQQRVVANRIEILQSVLACSKFPPESQNIQAAIDGYRAGKISYSSQYTLIWAGQIVDQANSYAEFTADRTERLDRYLKDYGPHWLWWESPLEIHPDSAPRASRSTSLIRDIAFNGLGHYWITLCFWKRADWVRRLAPDIQSQPPPENISNNFKTSENEKVYCQSEGPVLAFRSLLDSGATYPSLYKHDLIDLGIELDNYAAQSVQSLLTVNGTIQSRIFEMFVTVVREETFSQLVDESDAVWPYHGKYLGGLCPVAQINVLPNDPDPQGYNNNLRLSGVLPFLACYVSSTPARNRMFLGEDRNDVMGGHKTPAHRRWDISMSSTDQVADPGLFLAFDDPKITFWHNQGDCIDEDLKNTPHASRIVFLPKRPGETVFPNHPKAQCDAARNGTDV